MNRSFTAVALIAMLATGAISTSHAVSLRVVIHDCGDDGKKFCPNAGYGKPMQDCLAQHFKQLTPACKGVMTKLNTGDHVTLF